MPGDGRGREDDPVRVEPRDGVASGSSAAASTPSGSDDKARRAAGWESGFEPEPSPPPPPSPSTPSRKSRSRRSPRSWRPGRGGRPGHAQRVGRQVGAAEHQRGARPPGPGFQVEPDAPPRLAGRKPREVDPPRLGRDRAAVERRRRQRQRRAGRGGANRPPPARCRAGRSLSDRQVSQGIRPTPERYLERAANRSGSVVPSPGISWRLPARTSR